MFIQLSRDIHGFNDLTILGNSEDVLFSSEITSETLERMLKRFSCDPDRYNISKEMWGECYKISEHY